MTGREEFEEFYLSNVGDRLAPYEPADNYYLDDTADDMWQAWQAAYVAGQEAMRERVVIVCHEYAADRDVTDGIIDVIRALEIEK